jgi:hypothetical protein
MHKDHIKTPLDALTHLAESLLATVERLSCTPRASKSDASRHVSIAQTAIDNVVRFAESPVDKQWRAYEVIHQHEGSVKAYYDHLVKLRTGL